MHAARLGLIAAAFAGLPPMALHAQAVMDTAPARSFEHAARAHTTVKLTGRYDPWFRKYTKRYFGVGFDWRLIKAQAVAESDLNPHARSAVGARGLMQVMPATFNLIQSSRSSLTSIDAPESNIAAGIVYDRDLWHRWEPVVPVDERPWFTFGSYNAGDGTIARAAGIARSSKLDHTRWESIERVAPTVPRWRYRETVGYVRKIEATYAELRRQP